MPLPGVPIGIGLNIMSDEIGADKTFFARLAAAYNKQIGAGKLGVGLDVGILQKQINTSWITPEPGKVDGTIPGSYNGGASSNPNLSKITYDLGFGAFYQIPNKMYVGISSSHLPAQTIQGAGNVKFDMVRHYYIMAGYQLALNPMHSITPNVKVKTDAATTQVDMNLTYMYNNSFWVGVTYRLQDAVAPMLGVRLLKDKSLKVGYSYDYTLSKIKGYTSGTHEIMLGYCMNLKKAKPATVSGNVRFME